MPLASFIFDALARNWAIVAISLTITSLVVLPVLVLAKYVRISLNIMRTTQPPLTRNPLDYERIDGEPVHFSAYDGLRLAGMVIRGRSDIPRRGMIIFAHEFCADKNSCARYCRPLLDLGYDVFTFDFRGHGDSPSQPGFTPRQWVTDRELDDMRGALAFVEEWLEQRGLPPEIGVFGISRGACAAILIAAEDARIKTLVVDGAFSTDTSIEYFMKRWAYIFAKVRVVYENHHPAFWRFLRWTMIRIASREFKCNFPSVRKAIKRMTPRPMLFIHGEKDSYLPVEQSRLLYALAGQPKSLWIAPNARHNQAAIVHPETYAAMTTRFFDRHLARIEPGSAAAAPPAPIASPNEDETPRIISFKASA